MNRKANTLIFNVIFLAIFFTPKIFLGQVIETFQNGLLNSWYSEGDGNYSISSTISNPDFSFKVDDDATGSINYAIAPNEFLGDWSGATFSDSIIIDVYVESSDTDLIAGEPPVFEIISNGGSASILNGLDLDRNVWHTIAVSLNPNDWVLESGTWEGLVENVSLFRIRAEYISGNENVYLDNIQLTFTPVEQEIVDTLCSDFESETYDGWSFVENGAIAVNSSNGNPGFSIEVQDLGSAISQALAPPKFLGDWTAFDDIGTIKFDLFIDTNSPNSLYSKDYLIKITGGSSSAQINVSEAEQNLAINQWHTYEFIIDESNWSIISGNWNSLISDVNEIRIELEYIVGDETAYLDNFCITPNLPTNLTDALLSDNIDIYPNPSTGIIFVSDNNDVIENVELFNPVGQRITSNIELEDDRIKVYISYKGLLFIMLKTGKGDIVKKVFVN